MVQREIDTDAVYFQAEFGDLLLIQTSAAFYGQTLVTDVDCLLVRHEEQMLARVGDSSYV
jgi:hypothetical protein